MYVPWYKMAVKRRSAHAREMDSFRPAPADFLDQGVSTSTCEDDAGNAFRNS
jgi:hypothetical protein